MKKINLTTEYDEYYKNSNLRNSLQIMPLPIKGTINGFDCFFFNADLFGLLVSEIQKDGIATSEFINDYKRGFEKGLLHLEEEEKIELKDLKSKDLREGTILQLKNILHEREFHFGSKGLLELVFNKLPLIFTKKNIFNYGYWNGIIYSIDEISEKAGLSLNELKTLPPQQTTNESETETVRYTAKHYVLAYIIECNAKGKSFPVGQKKELEKIGNKKMGAGKGNRFYKVFNEIVNKDLNAENNLIEIGGENWRKIVKDLSSDPETIETYLQSKHL